MDELYKTYRPTTTKGLRGQDDAVKMLNSLLTQNSLPHTILFTGPSGTGKTTTARILALRLKCDSVDLQEINAAEERGIELIRGIQKSCGLSPLQSPCRIYIIDEVHQLVSHAQQAFLKLLEDTPKHVYFFLCTTDPNKLLKTIVTRCTEVKLRSLQPKALGQLVTEVAAKAEIELHGEVLSRILEYSDGSARKALVLLNQIRHIETEDEQLDCLSKSDSRQAAFELCRALMDTRKTWGDVAAILKGLEEEPESIRHMVLGYFHTILLSGKNAQRAALVIDRFQVHFYDSKKAGLALACYEVVTAGKK